MDKLVVGVIGAGVIGEQHSRIFSELHNTELKAIADLNKDKAKAVAEKFGAKNYYAGYSEMLADSEIKAVSIATPDFLHKDAVVDAAIAGKHILVEKPLATTLEEADQMVEAVKKSGVKLMVDYFARWLPAYVTTKSILSSGDIGEVVTANARKDDTIFVATELISWASKTSPAMFLSTHDIDAVKWFIGQDVDEVYATGRKGVLSSKGVDTYDAIQAIVKFHGGASAVFQSSWLYPNSYPTLVDSFVQLIGSKGSLMIDRNRQNLEVCTDAKYRFQDSNIISGSLRGPMRLSLEHFVDCVINDKEPISSLENGRAIVEIISAIHHSIDTGKLVKLPPR
jgi:predicted dehydrogenase